MATAEKSASWDSGFDDEASNEPNFSFDTSNTSKDDLGGSNIVEKPGWYHFEVTDVKAEMATVGKKGGEKSPHVLFTLSVLNSIPGQAAAGAMYFHRCYVAAKGGKGEAAEGAVNSNLRFLYGLGALVESDTQKKEDGTPVLVDAVTKEPNVTWETFKRCKERQLIARVVLGEPQFNKPNDPASGVKYEGRYEIPFGRTFRPDDPQVADVEKDGEALKLAGYDPAKCGKLAGVQAAAGAAPANGSGKKSAPANKSTAGPDLSDL